MRDAPNKGSGTARESYLEIKLRSGTGEIELILQSNWYWSHHQRQHVAANGLHMYLRGILQPHHWCAHMILISDRRVMVLLANCRCPRESRSDHRPCSHQEHFAHSRIYVRHRAVRRRNRRSGAPLRVSAIYFYERGNWKVCIIPGRMPRPLKSAPISIWGCRSDARSHQWFIFDVLRALRRVKFILFTFCYFL